MELEKIKEELREIFASARPRNHGRTERRRALVRSICRQVRAAGLDAWFHSYLASAFGARTVEELSDCELARAAAFVRRGATVARAGSAKVIPLRRGAARMLRRTVLVGLVALGCAFTGGRAGAFDDDAIRRSCSARWGTDFKMVKYCVDQQRTAGSRLDSFAAQAAPGSTEAVVLSRCSRKWGTDYNMIVYCIDQQAAAVRQLGRDPDPGMPSDVAATIRSRCARKWGTDFSMVKYCVDQQTTAWRALQQ